MPEPHDAWGNVPVKLLSDDLGYDDSNRQPVLLDIVDEDGKHVEVMIKYVRVDHDEIRYFGRVGGIRYLRDVLISFAHLGNGARRDVIHTMGCSAAALMMRPEGISKSMSMSISISVRAVVQIMVSNAGA